MGQFPADYNAFGPTDVAWAPPYGYFQAPSGAPLMTPELTSPVHWPGELHCYECPDGAFRWMRVSEAGYGCEARDFRDPRCPGGMPLADPVGPQQAVVPRAPFVAVAQGAPPAAVSPLLVGAGILAAYLLLT
jgi:hypothetical protein